MENKHIVYVRQVFRSLGPSTATESEREANEQDRIRRASASRIRSGQRESGEDGGTPVGGVRDANAVTGAADDGLSSPLDGIDPKPAS